MIQTRLPLPKALFLGARLLPILVGTAIGAAMLPARADVVMTWNEKAIELLPKMGKQGPFNLRGLAMMHAAIFDAVNAVERRYAPFKVEVTAALDASAEAAAAGAARRVLLELVPQERAAIDTVFNATVENLPGGDARMRGAALGEDVAVKIALGRADDGSDKLVAYVPRSGHGLYVPTS